MTSAESQSNNQKIQQLLIDCLRREEEQYAAAAALIERLSRSSQAGEPHAPRDVAALQKHLSTIRTTGGQIRNVVQMFHEQGLKRSPQLEAELRRQEERLQDFLQRIDHLKDVFTEARQTLEVRLDGEATHRAMHQAYSRALRTGS